MVLCAYEHTRYQRVNKIRHGFSVCSTEVMKMNPFGGVQRKPATENDVQATVQSIMTVIDLKGAAGRKAPCWNKQSPQLNNKSQSCSQPARGTTYQKRTMTTQCKYQFYTVVCLQRIQVKQLLTLSQDKKCVISIKSSQEIIQMNIAQTSKMQYKIHLHIYI